MTTELFFRPLAGVYQPLARVLAVDSVFLTRHRTLTLETRTSDGAIETCQG